MQLKNIRFDNPMFSLTTTFNRKDFTKLLIEQFKVDAAAVNAFFDAARGMNFYDDQQMTTRELFDRYFPGREDVIRLLMEPITYANGSTLEDPAISYGIVFSMGIYYINRLINKGPEGRVIEPSEALPSRPLSAAEGAAREAMTRGGH